MSTHDPKRKLEIRYQGGEGVRVVVLLLGTGGWLQGGHGWDGNVLGEE